MPVIILAGLLLITVALVMYSIGVWGAFRAKGASKRHILMMWLGFAGDFLGTVMMAIQPAASVQAGLAANPSAYIFTVGMGGSTFMLENTLSTYIAIAAMFAMLVSIIVAMRASSKQDASLAKTMSRVILAPWVLWVVSFVMMSVEKMPKRG